MKELKGFFIIAGLVIVLDQITKYLFNGVNFGIFRYTVNDGAAFSILSGNVGFLIFASIIALLFLFYFELKVPQLYLPLGFIFGGTIGNLIDRVLFGHVRDFIDLKVWPIFNVADSFNVIGAIIIGWYIMKGKI